MESLYLRDFRYGLDTRRSDLTQKPGTLEVLTNGFVNAGGEIQNRKAFVRTAQIAASFGLQTTAAGLLTFGSDSTPGGYPLSLGTGISVNYQRLQHPAMLAGEVYDAAKYAMTAVVHSTEYRGFAVVFATYADGKTYGYYNGTPIYDFIDGLVLAYENTDIAKICAAIAAMVNRTADYTAVAASPNVAVTGPLGQPYNTNVTDTSAAGTLAATKTSDPTNPVAAKQAIGSFEIVAGNSNPGTVKVSKVEVNSVTITNAAVDWTTSNEVTAGLLAASINTKSSSPEYTATANGAIVSIFALASAGATPNNFVVTVTCAAGSTAAGICVGRAQFQVIVAASPTVPFALTETYINGAAASGAVAAAGTAFQMATAIATAINAGPLNGTYLANATGGVVSVSRIVTSSSDAQIPIYFITAGAGPGNGIFEIGGGTGGVSTITVLLLTSGKQTRQGLNGALYVKYYLQLSISGGLIPYLAPTWYGGVAVTALGGSSYVTEEVSGGTIWNPINVPPHIYCVITDSLGNTASSNIL